jgi:hypothetical protein
MKRRLLSSSSSSSSSAEAEGVAQRAAASNASSSFSSSSSAAPAAPATIVDLSLMVMTTAMQAYMAAFLSYSDQGMLARTCTHFQRVTLMPAASPSVLEMGWWQSAVLPPVLTRSWSKTVVLDCSRTEFRAPMAEVYEALARNPRIRTLVLRSWMFKELSPLPFTISTLTALTVHGPIYDNGELLAQIKRMAPNVKDPITPGLGWKLPSKVKDPITLTDADATDVELPIPDDLDWPYDMEMHPFENDERGPGAQPGKGLDAGVCSLCNEEIGNADVLVNSSCPVDSSFPVGARHFLILFFARSFLGLVWM